MPDTFMHAYAQALAAQDWAKVEPLIHEEACVQFSEGTYVGKTSVKTAFERTFQLIKDEVYSISDVQWLERSDTLAVCIYTFSWSGIIDGKPERGSGRGTSVLKNTHGQWQLLVEHLGPAA